MPDDFDEFAQQIAAKNPDSKVVKRKIHQCPHCKEVIHESYIEQNPFPQIPCPSCGSLILTGALQNAEIPASGQRTDRRCPVSLKVSYQTYDNFLIEYTKNVSRGGMFIGTKHPHQINDIVDLFLDVPGLADPVHLKGEIVHLNTSGIEDGDAGVGVKFIDIEDMSRQALITFIKSQEHRS